MREKSRATADISCNVMTAFRNRRLGLPLKTDTAGSPEQR
jgi:hypothetical protein